jgi:hypothetical protein
MHQIFYLGLTLLQNLFLLFGAKLRLVFTSLDSFLCGNKGISVNHLLGCQALHFVEIVFHSVVVILCEKILKGNKLRFWLNRSVTLVTNAPHTELRTVVGSSYVLVVVILMSMRQRLRLAQVTQPLGFLTEKVESLTVIRDTGDERSD